MPAVVSLLCGLELCTKLSSNAHDGDVGDAKYLFPSLLPEAKSGEVWQCWSQALADAQASVLRGRRISSGHVPPGLFAVLLVRLPELLPGLEHATRWKSAAVLRAKGGVRVLLRCRADDGTIDILAAAPTAQGLLDQDESLPDRLAAAAWDLFENQYRGLLQEATQQWLCPGCLGSSRQEQAQRPQEFPWAAQPAGMDQARHSHAAQVPAYCHKCLGEQRVELPEEAPAVEATPAPAPLVAERSTEQKYMAINSTPYSDLQFGDGSDDPNRGSQGRPRRATLRGNDVIVKVVCCLLFVVCCLL
jgi:hypothetical protein